MKMKSIATIVAASMIGLTLGLSSVSVYAATNVADCDAVMKDLAAGKSRDDIAKEQNIQKRQIRTCEKKAAKAAAKAAASPAAEASPAAPPEAPKP
jgi:hypothetical protein